MTRAFALIVAALLTRPAAAMVGGAPAVDARTFGGAVVLIVGSKGSFCTGTALSRTLIITAAHCVPPGADYKLVEFDAAHRPVLKSFTEIVQHPEFSLRGMHSNRGTADIALLKLAAPLPAAVEPARLGGAPQAIEVGDLFKVAGYGVTQPGHGRSGGTLRMATLVATGHPDSMDVRLTDPTARNARAGRGACTGDSGAPVFRHVGDADVLIGVVGWSTGPQTTKGCGGLTGVTPLARYRAWIANTARKLGTGL